MISLINLHVFGLWEEAGDPRERETTVLGPQREVLVKFRRGSFTGLSFHLVSPLQGRTGLEWTVEALSLCNSSIIVWHFFLLLLLLLLLFSGSVYRYFLLMLFFCWVLRKHRLFWYFLLGLHPVLPNHHRVNLKPHQGVFFSAGLVYLLQFVNTFSQLRILECCMSHPITDLRAHIKAHRVSVVI